MEIKGLEVMKIGQKNFLSQVLLDLLPEQERKNWWEVSVVIDSEGE